MKRNVISQMPLDVYVVTSLALQNERRKLVQLRDNSKNHKDTWQKEIDDVDAAIKYLDRYRYPSLAA